MGHFWAKNAKTKNLKSKNLKSVDSIFPKFYVMAGT